MTLPRGRPRALPITFRFARPCCHCRGGAWANALVGCPTCEHEGAPCRGVASGSTGPWAVLRGVGCLAAAQQRLGVRSRC